MSDKLAENETARTEAFSDGIFAFAITLLVLGLADPTRSTSISLSEGLWSEWPSFFALVTSFVTILIMWMNHHNMFRYIRRIDRRLMLLNGLLLLFVILTPFTTALVANHILSNDTNARTAASVYAGTFLLLSLVWNGLWRYSSGGHRLLGNGVSEDQAHTITRQYAFAPFSYLTALLLSFYNGVLSVTVILLVAGFFAITATIGEKT